LLGLTDSDADPQAEDGQVVAARTAIIEYCPAQGDLMNGWMRGLSLETLPALSGCRLGLLAAEGEQEPLIGIACRPSIYWSARHGEPTECDDDDGRPDRRGASDGWMKRKRCRRPLLFTESQAEVDPAAGPCSSALCRVDHGEKFHALFLTLRARDLDIDALQQLTLLERPASGICRSFTIVAAKSTLWRVADARLFSPFQLRRFATWMVACCPLIRNCAACTTKAAGLKVAYWRCPNCSNWCI
jgi:hypothetical protein